MAFRLDVQAYFFSFYFLNFFKFFIKNFFFLEILHQTQNNYQAFMDRSGYFRGVRREGDGRNLAEGALNSYLAG